MTLEKFEHCKGLISRYQSYCSGGATTLTPFDYPYDVQKNTTWFTEKESQKVRLHAVMIATLDFLCR